MKKILLSILILISFNTVAQQVFTISHPIYGGVYQRNSSKEATIYFCGQANRASAYYIDYRLHTLDKNGTIVSSGSWENGITTVSSTNHRIFRFSKVLGTGWYFAEIRVRDSGGSQTDNSGVKFGVGEVFVIAGQSNAQGYGPETFGISGLSNLDCVRSSKIITEEVWEDVDTVGVINNLNNLSYPSIGKLTHNDNVIGPRGARSWYYQHLGNNIAENATSGKVTPVMFFNAAVSGTSVNNWKKGMLRTREMFSNNYSNNIVTGASSSINSSQYPDNTSWGAFNQYPTLFLGLKGVLSSYGNIFGVRAVLWHQGEADHKTITNIHMPGTYKFVGDIPSNYAISQNRTQLEEIINETRTILPGLKWAISKVSLIAEIEDASGNRHDNMVNNALRASPENGKSWTWSNPVGTYAATATEIYTNKPDSNIIKQQELVVSGNSTYVTFFTEESDNYHFNNSSRQSVDGVHFSNTGLISIANEAYSKITSNVLSMAPVLPTPPPTLTIYHSGGFYYTSSVSAPSGVTYSKFQWEYHYGGLSWNDLDQSTSTTTNSFTSDISTGGWVKDNIGRIHLIPFASYINTGFRKAGNQISAVVYPNPIDESSVINISFNAESSEVLKVKIFSEDGNLIKDDQEFETKSGDNTFSIKLPERIKQSSYPFSSIYVHLISNEEINKIKVLVK